MSQNPETGEYWCDVECANYCGKTMEMDIANKKGLAGRNARRELGWNQCDCNEWFCSTCTVGPPSCFADGTHETCKHCVSEEDGSRMLTLDNDVTSSEEQSITLKRPLSSIIPTIIADDWLCIHCGQKAYSKCPWERSVFYQFH